MILLCIVVMFFAAIVCWAALYVGALAEEEEELKRLIKEIKNDAYCSNSFGDRSLSSD